MRFAPTLAALALIATPALAQQGGGMQGMDHGSMQGMNHDDMSRMMAGNPYGRDGHASEDDGRKTGRRG
jgi:uncharacterized protein YdeI (BOF family)